MGDYLVLRDTGRINSFIHGLVTGMSWTAGPKQQG